MAYRTAGAELDAHPELCNAVAAAFALVATSDGEIAESERARFETWLLVEHATRSLLHVETLTHFDALCARLLARDAESARRDALACMSTCKEQVQRELVLSAARAALVADQRIDEREEAALRRICQALELDPDQA